MQLLLLVKFHVEIHGMSLPIKPMYKGLSVHFKPEHRAYIEQRMNDIADGLARTFNIQVDCRYTTSWNSN